MQINLTPELISLGVSLVSSLIVTGSIFAVFNYRVKRLEQEGKNVSDDVKTISSKLDKLIGKVSVLLKDNLADTLSESNSPRRLNDLGLKVLKDSKIETVLTPLFDEIIQEVQSSNPSNPYQAQEALFEVVQKLRSKPELQESIENGAFLSGHTPEEVLYVGALNMRDSVIEKLGLKVEEIDVHDPSKKSDKNEEIE